MQDETRECLDKQSGSHSCEGYVTGRESESGTGTIIYRCAVGHRKAAARHAEIRERYPDSSIAPDWFDPTYAGERWDEDD
ncbi:hypothetical protein [Streptomyces sp. NPDC059761]|uniref:hypothetical protein n=1 Tax=Streptomyces sp. NPDC059761 TaxID=3346937 RepID=UPI0036625045